MSLEGGRNQSTSRESIQTHAEQGLGSALRTTQQQDRCTVALKGQMNCILRKHWENGGKKAHKAQLKLKKTKSHKTWCSTWCCGNNVEISWVFWGRQRCRLVSVLITFVAIFYLLVLSWADSAICLLGQVYSWSFFVCLCFCSSVFLFSNSEQQITFISLFT